MHNWKERYEAKLTKPWMKNIFLSGTVEQEAVHLAQSGIGSGS